MATKKKVKKRIVKKEVVQHAVPVRRTGLTIDKSDGIMAIMAAILVILTAILDPKVSAILAIVLMILFGGWKLLKR